LDDPLAFRSPLSRDAEIARYTGEMALQIGYDRSAQDDWAFTSHHRYGEAIASGALDDQMLSWSSVLSSDEFPGRTDEQYRPDISLAGLSKLAPVYGSPTVTAGNAPGLNDGAASAMVLDERHAPDLPPGASGTIVDYLETAGGVTEAVLMPGRAIRSLVERNGLTLEDISVFEINEAYAATVLCSTHEAADGDRAKARLLRDRTNLWGGAIAIGHPLGASGVRIALNVVAQLRKVGGGYGIAAVCGGFGQTDALLLRVG
jgi:acetyl-CoA C-acetyltransferase